MYITKLIGKIIALPVKLTQEIYQTIVEETGWTKVWCECGHEILQDRNSKIYDGGSFYHIICANCDKQTRWEFD